MPPDRLHQLHYHTKLIWCSAASFVLKCIPGFRYNLIFFKNFQLGIHLSANEAALYCTTPMRCGAVWWVQLSLKIAAKVCAWGTCVVDPKILFMPNRAKRSEKIVKRYIHWAHTKRCLLWWTDNNRIRPHSVWSCSPCMPQVVCMVYTTASRRYSVARLHSCSTAFPVLVSCSNYRPCNE